jgi:hypothetical protein
MLPNLNVELQASMRATWCTQRARRGRGVELTVATFAMSDCESVTNLAPTLSRGHADNAFSTIL